MALRIFAHAGSVLWILIITALTAHSHISMLGPCSRNSGNIHNCGWAQKECWFGCPQADNTGPLCGVCGDRIVDSTCKNITYSATPQPHEYMGQYWNENACKAYTRGQIFNVSMAYWNPHNANTVWRLAEDTSLETYVENGLIRQNRSSFKHKLEIIWASDSRFVPTNSTVGGKNDLLKCSTNDANTYITVTLRLPESVTCTHCVIQMTALAGTNMFRTCGDIMILPKTQLLQLYNTTQCLSKTSGYGLQLATCNISDWNQWVISLGPSIMNLNQSTLQFQDNRKCLDVDCSSKKNGTRIGNYDCKGSKNQLFTAVRISDNTIWLMSELSDLCLTATPTWVSQTYCNTTMWQVWTVVTGDANSTSTLVDKPSKKDNKSDWESNKSESSQSESSEENSGSNEKGNRGKGKGKNN